MDKREFVFHLAYFTPDGKRDGFGELIRMNRISGKVSWDGSVTYAPNMTDAAAAVRGLWTGNGQEALPGRPKNEKAFTGYIVVTCPDTVVPALVICTGDK